LLFHLGEQLLAVDFYAPGILSVDTKRSEHQFLIPQEQHLLTDGLDDASIANVLAISVGHRDCVVKL